MEKNENKETYEISLKDLFSTFKKGLWIMLVTAVAFAAVAYGYFSFFVQKTYTATVKLYVVSSGTGESAYGDLSAHNLSTALVKTYIDMLSSNHFREQLAENLDEKYTPDELGKMVSFSSDEKNETEVFKASVNAPSPTEAKIIADSVEDVAPGIIANLANGDANLKIVDSAMIPTAPSAPNVTRNTVLAFAAGFVLALAFVFIREALDNKVKYSPDDIEINGIPILSAVPDFEGEPIILGNTPKTPETEAE